MTNQPWFKLTSYYVGFMSIGLTAASLGPTLPGLMAQTGVTLQAISFLFVVRPIGYLLGSVAVGRLYDSRPGHPFMVGAILITSASMFLIPVAPVFWLVLVVMFIVGVVESAIDIGGNTLLAWTYGDKVAPYMSGLHFMFGLGAFIAPLIVAQAALLGGGITWAYWTLAVLILPGAFLLWRAPSPAVRTRAEVEARGSINYVLVGLLMAFFFLYVGAEIGFGAWIFTYATRLGLANETDAALLNSLFWGALTAGRLLSIPVASRVRPRTVLGVSLAGCIVSLALPVFWPASATMLWVCAMGTGLFMAPVFATTMSFAERRLSLTGQISSFFFIGASLGGMVVPWIVGQLFEPLGPFVAPLAFFISILLDSVVFVALMLYAPQPARVVTPVA